MGPELENLRVCGFGTGPANASKYSAVPRELGDRWADRVNYAP
jgi:hypothetical protein